MTMEYHEENSFLYFNEAIVHCITDNPEYYGLVVRYDSNGEFLGVDVMVLDREVKVYE